MALQRVIDVKGVPIRGGANTDLDRGLLKFGEFSMVQNVVPLHPGFEKRSGQRLQHSTADTDGGNPTQIMSAYQFKKTRNVENIYLAQANDGDVLTLTTAPPGVTTGAIGSELWSGTASPNPACWSNLNDVLIFSNGVDQHKLYAGTTTYVDKFIVYKGATADITLDISYLTNFGDDYSEQVSDGQTTTYAYLNSLDDKDAGDAIFICTQVPASSFTFTVVNTNANTVTSNIYYFKNTYAWTAVSGFVDGTSASSKTFAQTGTMSFTAPTDMIPRYLFGRYGYWYMVVSTANALDSTVSLSSVTYNSTFADMCAFWDGVADYAVEVLVEGAAAPDEYDKYTGDAVNVDALPAGDAIYIASLDPIDGIYFDPGSTPNVNTTMEISKVQYRNASAWADMNIGGDGSGACNQPGWLICYINTTPVQWALFTSIIYGYWYKIYWKTANFSDDVVLAIKTMPRYDIHDYGYVGQCSCVWKTRACYTWADKYPEYVYITPPDQPQVLVSTDAAIVQVGDGRPHKVVAMRPFFSNLLVWQEEKGEIGGCLTMIQGYSPATFGKLVLSSKVGTMSNKTVDVVENVFVSTETDQKLETVAYFISRYGVAMTDGRAITFISDDIQNYFDPNETSTCIRKGYENQMWLKHDPIAHVLRLGLVCGTSATTCNVFPVYDLVDHCWYFDVRAQELCFWENLEAGSGDTSIVQVGGGTDDGYLYQVNYGTADISTAIDTYLRIEFPGYGQYLDLLQFMLTCKAQTGNITLTTYQNNISKDSLTLSMAAEYSTQEIRRHLLSLNVLDQQVSVKIQNSSASESMTLMAVGLEVKLWANR